MIVLEQKNKRDDENRRDAGIDPQFHVAVADEIGRREQKRRARHRIAQPPAQAAAR